MLVIQQLLAGIRLIPKKSTELSKRTQIVGKLQLHVAWPGPDSTLGEKGEKINLASEGSQAVVWGWERVGEPGGTP